MPDSIDESLDREDQEYARERRVGPGSQIIFTSLRNALKERVVKYNERYKARHQQENWTPRAILIDDDPFRQTAYGLTIRATFEPTASLKVDFPINSGAMELRFKFGSDEEVVDAIKLDIREKTPEFYLDGRRLSADSLAERSLFLLLGEDDPILASAR